MKPKLSPGHLRIVLASAAAVAGIPLPSVADISLADYAFNQDGVVSVAPSPPPVGSSFNTTTGLGTVEMTFSGAGLHQAFLFVDHELSETVNTYFNELGSTSLGSPPAGLSWEIDEPGYSFGDIYGNFLAASLDNTIGTAAPEDVSMALGWNFVLGGGETGLVSFVLSDTPPLGFHLRHFDPDSGENVYFSSSLAIGAPIIPESQTAVVGLAGIALAVASIRRFRPR